jgi:phenylpropionate dioxygenase-like ring-hydroxylating dioxygenase large terminal subunit
MLSKEQNELLTRVGPGTPMGGMLREFWVPACRSARLEADGAPARVRLFGENFVAFRATDGRVGFLNEGCPHRGVSLALARNEDCALTCIFHGWKIDVSGKVVEVPSEPVGSTLASKVRVHHYPVHEAGGVIWVWLGKAEKPPRFPDFEFNSLPEENLFVQAAIVNCNWVQSLEGNLDSSHLTALHKHWLWNGAGEGDGAFADVMGNLAPRFEVITQPYGYTAAATRELPDGRKNIRSTQFVQPWYSFIPINSRTRRSVIMTVPIDDEFTYQWFIEYSATEKATRLNFNGIEDGVYDQDNFYQPRYGADKIWGQDRELMKQGHYTGLRSLGVEDIVVQESMGPIVDRSQEHLGTSDVAIIRMRRILLDMVQDYKDGKPLRGLELDYDLSSIHATHETLAPGLGQAKAQV